MKRCLGPVSGMHQARAEVLCRALLGPDRHGMRLRRSAVPYRDRASEPPHIDPDAPKLIYVQVADHIAARIAARELAPGARLPAERDLATEYGVSYDTIRRATALLRDRELIITIVGRGTYVSPDG